MTGPVADLIRPPYVTVSWTATGFTTEFNGYRVYRRPARLPVAPWAIIGDISVPDIVIATAGESTARTQIEAQHTKFIDYEAGWAAGGYTEGWDYATTVRTKNGLESLFSTLVTGKTITAARNPWLCSNAKPYLNTPIRMYVNELETAVESAAVQNRYLGRDFTMTRTPSELPSRTLESASWYLEALSTEQVRGLRAVEASGQSVAFLRPSGDRVIGTVTIPSWKDEIFARTTATFAVMETDHESAVADYNLPSGYALNGTNQYMRTANNALLNPGSGPFSIVALGVYPNSSGIIVSKRAAGVGDGYVISSFGGNTAIFLVDGASATATLSGADATTFDGNPHVLVGTHSGTAQVLYRDATVIDSDTVTTGAVTNTGTFTAGAYDGGSNFYAMNPLHAWAYYPRVLTATEVLNVTRYLLGVPGYRPPAGANAFYDFRDSRSDARLNEVPDLSGNGLTASMIGSTFFRRGYPWALDELEQFSP